MDEIKTSEFNEAQFQILRLNNIWVTSRSYREKGKLLQWKWILLSAEVELNNDAMRIDKQKKTNWIEQIDLINEEIEKNEASFSQKDLFVTLVKKEKLLKSLQEGAGKGTKLKFEEEKF